jgi:hypothetical protein
MEVGLAFVTFLLGVIGTYLSTRRNLELQYDAELRRDRVSTYLELWEHTGALPRYTAGSGEFTRANAKELTTVLQRWYFGKGGLFLSRETRGDYFELKKGLDAVIKQGWGRGADADGPLQPEAVEFLRVLGSRLRTSMTRDVGTRATFKLRDDIAGVSPGEVAGAYIDHHDERVLNLSFTSRLGRRGWRLARVRKPRVTWQQRAGAQAAEVEIVRWDPERQAIGARFPETDVGASTERLLLVEPAALVEGPMTWERERDDAPRAGVWRKNTAPFDGDPVDGRHTAKQA